MSQNYPKDWKDTLNEKKVVKDVYDLSNNIIDNIYYEKLEIHNKFLLKRNEISILFHFLIYKSSSIFFERLFRVIYHKDSININSFCKTNDNEKYYSNTSEVMLSNYYDKFINYNLINKIYECIYNYSQETSIRDKSYNPIKYYKKIRLPKKVKNFLKILIMYKNLISAKLFRPKVIAEDCHWAREIFPFWNIINFQRDYFNDEIFKIDKNSRTILKKIFERTFLYKIDQFNISLDNLKKKELSKIFSNFVESFLPISLIEGLDLRFKFYLRYFKNLRIEQIHSWTGFSYDDNLKVFSILAKRNSAKLIGHEHGVENYSIFDLKYSTFIDNSDLYTIYGKYFNLKDYNNIEFSNKIIPIGSVFLKNLKKSKKNSINKKKLKILYPSGPVMQFSDDVKLISPEKYMWHRKNVSNFFEKLLEKFSNIEVSYKPFPGYSDYDPFKNLLQNLFKEKRIIYWEEHSTKGPKIVDIYSSFDLVLWDYVSSGFAETIHIGTPSLIFNSKFDYQRMSDRGKYVHDLLIKSGIEFFDIETGLKTFEKFYNDYESFKTNTESSCEIFVKDKATPVSAKQWRATLENKLK